MGHLFRFVVFGALIYFSPCICPAHRQEIRFIAMAIALWLATR